MKKFLLVTLVLSISILTQSQDVIPNYSFEDWDGAPVHWVNPLAIAGINNIVQSNDAQHGELSARLFTVWSENTNEWVGATVNSLAIPLTTQPSTLNGFYKANFVEGDIISISITLYNDNLISGTGFLAIEASTTDWTSFSVPITYIGTAPTDAFIYVILADEMGNAHEGTECLIDNLSWDGSSSVTDLQKVNDLSLAPNPADDHVSLQFTLEQPDRIAFELLSLTGQMQTVIPAQAFTVGKNSVTLDTDKLQSGLYFLRATGEKYGFTQKVMIR